jgi:hypothetical protein
MNHWVMSNSILYSRNLTDLTVLATLIHKLSSALPKQPFLRLILWFTMLPLLTTLRQRQRTFDTLLSAY